MSKISEAFLRALGNTAKGGIGRRKAYLPYVCLGDPDGDFSLRLMKALQESGADAIEAEIPFSDTLADGQAIQGASERALSNGMNVEKALSLIKKARQTGITIPIIPMTYYNLVFHYGVERFCTALHEAGGDGLILPDVPLEESGELVEACRRHSLDFIYLVAPTTTGERLARILAQASGFVYVVAVMGTTGARSDVSQEAVDTMRRVKALSTLPVAIGFGVSKQEHASFYSRAGADGVVEGSELVNIYNKFFENGVSMQAKAAAIEAVSAHAREMKAALK